MANILELIKKY